MPYKLLHRPGSNGNEKIAIVVKPTHPLNTGVWLTPGTGQFPAADNGDPDRSRNVSTLAVHRSTGAGRYQLFPNSHPVLGPIYAHGMTGEDEQLVRELFARLTWLACPVGFGSGAPSAVEIGALRPLAWRLARHLRFGAGKPGYYAKMLQEDTPPLRGMEISSMGRFPREAVAYLIDCIVQWQLHAPAFCPVPDTATLAAHCHDALMFLAGRDSLDHHPSGEAARRLSEMAPASQQWHFSLKIRSGIGPQDHMRAQLQPLFHAASELPCLAHECGDVARVQPEILQRWFFDLVHRLGMDRGAY